MHIAPTQKNATIDPSSSLRFRSRSHPLFHFILPCLLTTFVGCAYGGGSGAGIPNTGRIVGGSPENNYAAVGALMENGAQFCTGTLVTPTEVVTAAHCVADNPNRSGVSFFIGNDANNPSSGTSIPVSGMFPHPSFDWYSLANDIAVVRLSSAASVSPIPINTEPMTSEWLGVRPLFVGFGITVGGGQDNGRKRSVRIAITEIGDTQFGYADSEANTCNGDSGGPALSEVNGSLRILGVTSYGDIYCSTYGADTRVDAFASFINGYLNGGSDDGGGWDDGGNTDGGGDWSDDWCQMWGWYGDGVCDVDCPQPDPDCGGAGGDWDDDSGSGGGWDYCEMEGWYGDGVCDSDCPQPDPDCQDGPDNSGSDEPTPDDSGENGPGSENGEDSFPDIDLGCTTADTKIQGLFALLIAVFISGAVFKRR